MMTADDSNWTCIYASSKVHEVEIFRGLLADHQIHAVVINKQDSAYLFGEAELYVKTDDALTARHIISNTDRE